MTALSYHITERRKREAALEMELASLRDEIFALEKAEAILGGQILVIDPKGIQADHAKPKNGGKPAGAISHKWREVMSVISMTGESYTIEEIQKIAIRAGLEIELSSVKQRVKNFVDYNYMRQVDPGKFAVTEVAIDRFDLDDITKYPNT